MKLLPQLSLINLILVSFTAFLMIFFGYNTTKNILFDLNAQSIHKELNYIHQLINIDYQRLGKKEFDKQGQHYQAMLQKVQKAFLKSNPQRPEHLLVFDQQSRPVINTWQESKSLNWMFLENHHLEALEHASVSKDQAHLIDVFKKQQYLFFYKVIAQGNLGVVIFIKEDNLYHRLSTYMNNVLKVLVAVLLLALLMGGAFSKHLVKRIKIVLDQIHAINHGNMWTRIKDIKGNDEISALKSGLNQMTEIISERMHKQVQAELKAIENQKSMEQKHALLQAFIEAMPELAFILDEDGQYIEIFGNDQNLLYKEKEKFLGKNLNKVLPKNVAAEVMWHIKQTIKTKVSHVLEYELEIQGETKYFLGNFALLEHTDKRKTDKNLVVWIAHDITEQTIAEKEAHQLSLYDPLTELANRRLLLERLEQEISRATRHQELGALLFIDLDNFKTINDTCGHRTGDMLLKQAASRLKNILRKEDLACRLGGDEFVVMLSHLENNLLVASTTAQSIAQKIIEIFQVPFEIESQNHQISCSIGVVVFPEASCDGHDFIKYADIAMYQAKEEGKNTVRLFAPHMQKVLEHRLQLQTDLRKVIKEEKLSIHLQPQFNDMGKITSAEALVRWKDPEKGFISPAEFVPIAEESGLVHDLGRSVMKMVLKELQNILELDYPHTFTGIAVNVSPWQFGRNDYVDEVNELLTEYHIPPNLLEIEITEQTLVGNFSTFSQKMKQMQEMGIRFSIDDFGTGYSSLAYLKSLPVNMLKIDRSFIRDITTDKNDAAIVDTIIVMAHHLGMEVIAEGVETKEQVNFLSEHKCGFFQGYYFSKPLPANEFVEILMKQ